MSLPTANEYTEGPGGMRVYDPNGLYVGRLQSDTDVPPPSEDMARVLLHTSEDARRAVGLTVKDVDLDATWLHAPDEGDHLVLDRPFREALLEQGFDV